MKLYRIYDAKIHAYWEKIFQEQQFDEFLCIIYERQNAEHQLL